jgi:DNA-directed RNA polymerase subunit RPC12/RpoP
LGAPMVMREKRPLLLVEAPSTRHVVRAPPPLVASTHTIDFTCANCGAVLLQADEEQVHELLIQCRDCGSYNATN